MKRNIGRAFLEIVSLATIWAIPATAQSFPGFGIVMTYNVNEGTDFVQVEGATSLQQFLLGVGQILTQVQGTNPPERMQAIAKQILAVQPESLFPCCRPTALRSAEQERSGTRFLQHSDVSLFVSWASFSQAHPLFSTPCGLLQKQGGRGRGDQLEV